MRSTQRCEGMNKYIKDYLKSGVKLVELIPAIARAQSRLRFKYSLIDFNTMNSKHILITQLKRLEEHASSIYTDNVFFIVREEIKKVCALVTEAHVQSNGFRTYTMWKYNSPGRRFNVVYFEGEGDCRIVCTCQKMEYEGIPCSHILNVMKHENMNEIPPSLVLKRWTKCSKCSISRSVEQSFDNDIVEVDAKAIFAYLSDRMIRLAHRASSSRNMYDMMNEEVNKWEEKMQQFSNVSEVVREVGGHHENLVRDPVVVKTKGRKKEPRKSSGSSQRSHTNKQRKCSKCGIYGHNRNTCGKNTTQNGTIHKRTTTPSSSSSEEDCDIERESESESDISPAGGQVPTSTSSEQHPLHHFAIPLGMPNVSGSMQLNEMASQSISFSEMLNAQVYGAGYSHIYGPSWFIPR
ncbi:hypothetical protein M0R45_030237 [Rubus argutus]|uniref:Protein FAR1-RELATED SEQUENCE n=1 Tax=Rubus argutus TaxID=59490 RepID=A0AAW1WA40_RUBAR